MGNCQTVDAAALVIQHPSGKIERMYWPISASEVMRLNPGHYVSLIIPLLVSDKDHGEVVVNQEQNKTVRLTRVKLLRPNETLALGHAYRLVTTQEVMKVLRAKKYAKTTKQQLETFERLQTGQEKQSSSCDEAEEGRSDKENINRATKRERHRPRKASANAAAAAAALRSKSRRPSLQSISEGVSCSMVPTEKMQSSSQKSEWKID